MSCYAMSCYVNITKEEKYIGKNDFMTAYGVLTKTLFFY